MRGNGSRITDCGVALMIEKIHAEIGIHCGLIGIGGGAVDLIQAESGEQRGLVREPVIDADRKLVGIGYHLGRDRIGPRAVGSLRIVRQRIAIQQRGDRRAHRND